MIKILTVCLAVTGGVLAGSSAGPAMGVPMVILDDDFESYSDQAAFETVWSEDGTTTYYLDTSWGAGGGQSVNLEPVPSGDGTSNRWFRDFGGTFNGSDAEPLVFSYDLYLHPDGASTLWANAFNSCDVRGYTGGGYKQAKQSDLVDLVGIGATWYLYPAGHQGNLYQRRTIAGSVPLPEAFGYMDLDAPTAPERLPGWHRMQAVVTSNNITFLVDGQIAGEVDSGLPFGINCIVVGTGSISEHALWVDNVRVEIIPEPATLSLLALGGLALVRRRSR